jgi:cyclohexyl-isocyanide hydratase
MMKKYKTGMLLFPDLTIQDFVGPYDVFIKAPCFEVFIVSESIEPIKAEGGLLLQANYTLDDARPSISYSYQAARELMCC